MTSYTFDSTMQGWTNVGAGTMAWTGSDGSPTAGCIWRGGSFGTAAVELTGLSIVLAGTGEYFGFKTKYTGSLSSVGGGAISLKAYDSGSVQLASAAGVWDGVDPAAGSWLELNIFGGNFTAGTISSLRMAVTGGGNSLTSLYFDSVYVAESPPATDTARRLLKMDSDGGNLFVSGISGGTLTMYQYSLAGLTVTSTSTFGTCSYTDPDTFTRGIFPVARPGGDGILYAYGRDANNVQVQYRDYNGTLGWVDVGAGTATWVTTKYCVALMPDIFRNDNLIAVFNDGSVYTTDNGTMLWDRQGSVTTTTLRTAARAQTTPEVIYVAGTAAGTIYQSCNNGNTFGAMGTSTMGTINALEVLD
jgi:hypothetical protein